MYAVNGSIVEWSPDTRLDTPQTGAAGYAIYGDIDADTLYFAITADDVQIGANTTIWLDTDLDRSTGYQIWGFAGGVEYRIEIGPDGIVRLFEAGSSGPEIATLEYAYSADLKTLELAVPLALLAGAPDRVRVFADVNNNVFLPNDYANVDMFAGDAAAPPAPPAVTYGDVTLDGLLDDWAPGTRLDDAATGTDGYALYGDVQGGAFVFAISADSVQIGTNTTIWLDTDLDRSTGYQIFGFTGGAEYNVNIGADGVARLYTGAAGQTLVGEIDYGYSSDGQVIELAVSQALLAGAPERIRVFADVNDAAFLPNDYANLNFFVGDVPSPPAVTYGDVTLDGALGDWAAGTRLDDAATGTAGYALYGDVQGDAFVFAISADSAQIGTNSTIWLDTDLDRGTGYQIFGFTGGAEYNVNIGADGVARLYTGAAGQTLVGEIDYGYSSDGQVIELAVSQALLAGAPERIRVFADVNDAAFLPNDYANIDFFVGEQTPPPPPPDNPQTRIAIVYSETTANNYFDKTAYGQLFMAAQNQAMQAGVPFDLLSEADLLDPANLSGYDAIVFPAFSHVKSADLTAITAALQSASTDYGVGMIAAGNFLTNDETGAAIAGDSYIRMKTLLGVTLAGFGETDGLELVAGAGANPVLDDYAPGETVGTYPNTSYLYFTDVTGAGQVLFDQVSSDGSHDALIATQTGGRNLHFATDAIIGNNNILGEAIDWAVHGDAPDVSLSMTRGTSLFYSRNDMDQSQEVFDVIDQEPSIYDVMIPIVEDWHARFGFVGSFYVNVGANPPDQTTDWSISGPYYEALLAMGSEIGSHSWTHPHDTNDLEGDTPELLQVLTKVDPRNPNAVDPWTLSASEQTLLYNSYRFQFEYSKLKIEKELGIAVAGAAVPGAPEKLDASREMIQFFDYLSGGYSGVGAGYPGAFGYLTPQDKGAVYLAPNMSFDFSLIGFQNLTPEQAEAVWAAEYDQITKHGTAPIIAFPWHDYGPTNWDLGDADPDTYTLEMFETVIARAAADGTEFVTGQDLAARIAAFEASSLNLTRDGAVTTATVGASGVGTFALTLDKGEQISSVDNWYAWDGNSVFLPRNGGEFRITTGTGPSDVTRLSELPMRGDLIDVSGDGSNLKFSFFGSGEADVTLRTQAADRVQILGADGGSFENGVATLNFAGIAQHDASVSYTTGGGRILGTAGSDMLIGGSARDRLVGNAGNDVMHGAAAVDTFVIKPRGGHDTVLDFTSGIDRLELRRLGFASSEEAYQAFVETSDGMELTFGTSNRVLLTQLDSSELTANDIFVV